MYERVDLEEGTPVQFVGVYILKWRKEWGQPTVGFREVECTDETLEADLLSFVRDFYDHYTELGWGTSGARLAQARALIERADNITVT